MTDLRKAAKMALEALDSYPLPFQVPAKEALRQALAQPEQEPVVWFIQYEDSHEFVWSKPDGWRVKQALEIQPLYTAPPKKEWVGLTDDEREHFRKLGFVGVLAVENTLKEKNS